MRYGLVATIAAIVAVSGAGAQEVPADTLTAIQGMLAAMQCEVDPDEVEATEAGGFELDDVFCADGQFDMELDAALAVIEKRKE